MILTYHEVKFLSGHENTVGFFTFLKQMLFLKWNKIRVVPLSKYRNDKREVAITFDDGYSCISRWAVPILSILKIPFSIFICEKFLLLAENGDKKYLNVKELYKIVKNGGGIEYHSKSHYCLTEIKDIEELKKEIALPDIIKTIDPLGGNFFAYPFWKHNDCIRQIVAEEYCGARSGNGFANGTSFAMDSVKVTSHLSFSTLFKDW